MRAPEPVGETPAEAEHRAERLRQHARTARTLAGALATHLDKEAAKAATVPPIWTGQYAHDTTGMLGTRSSDLHLMADDLRADARRWDAEADRVEHEAKQAAKQAKGGH